MSMPVTPSLKNSLRRSCISDVQFTRQSTKEGAAEPLAAHARAARSAVLQYFGRTMVRAARIPLFLALVSNVLAVATTWWGSEETVAGVSAAASCIVDVVLKGYLGPLMGFFTGFTLSNAFARYSRGLEIIQQLSVQLRAGTSEALAVLAKDHEGGMNDRARAHEIVAWVKVYFIHACRGLNSVTLRAKRRRLRAIMGQWDTFLDSKVQLSPDASEAVLLHSDIFVSTLQMELLWWRFLEPLLQWSQTGSHAGSSDFSETKKWFEAARKSFHSAHMLASGITASPVTVWLMSAVVYAAVITMPWFCVQKLGICSVIPVLFTTFIYFGALQLGADLWQPYGADDLGVVNVELFARADAMCEQLDSMLELFDNGHFGPLDMSAGPHFSTILEPNP